MKKQIVSALAILCLSACTTGRTGQKNATLADMFVWKQPEARQTQNVSVQYVEQIEPQYEQPIHIHNSEAYLEQKPLPMHTHAEPAQDVVVREIVVPSDVVVSDQPSQPYHLAKRADRYETADYNIDPQVYGIVASRTANKMLNEVPAILAEDKTAPMFIEETVYIDRYMPMSPDVAGKTVKEILTGSEMFNLTENRDEAELILSSSLNNVNTPEVPVFVYLIKLTDKNGKLLGSWSDSIRQVQNDDGSWW